MRAAFPIGPFVVATVTAGAFATAAHPSMEDVVSALRSAAVAASATATSVSTDVRESSPQEEVAPADPSPSRPDPPVAAAQAWEASHPELVDDGAEDEELRQAAFEADEGGPDDRTTEDEALSPEGTSTDDAEDDSVTGSEESLDRTAQSDSSLPAGPVLASIARETWVYAKPEGGARKLGYLRAGAVVEREAEPAGYRSCKGGWYRISPHGFVCSGKYATLDPFHPVVEASQPRPRRDGLPYPYVTSRYPTPAMYARLPTEEEQARFEPDLAAHLRKIDKLAASPDYVLLPEPGAIPGPLVYGRGLPGLANDGPRNESTLSLGRARVRSGFALLAHFDHGGRRFGLTTEMAILPLDRTRWVEPSTFEGVHLDAESPALAFVRRKHARRRVATEAGPLASGEPLGFRQPVFLTGAQRGSGASAMLETTEGFWVQAGDIVQVQTLQNPPAWSGGDRKWIDVSILRQSLVAYEGTVPVYATLVSTGADGIADPEESTATVRGAFLIHTKHVSVTMDGDDAGDEFDLRDVPFVQYFNEGYALHGAYWHDDFGTPRSHGCINLAPRDAAWLFNWTTPEVPDAWHAALSLKKGTLVYIHP